MMLRFGFDEKSRTNLFVYAGVCRGAVLLVSMLFLVVMPGVATAAPLELDGETATLDNLTAASSVVATNETAIVFAGGALSSTVATDAFLRVGVDSSLTLSAATGADIILDVPMTNAAPTALTAASSSDLVRITGDARFVKTGDGMLILGTGTNIVADYTGDTVVSNGTLRIGVDKPLPRGAGKGNLDLAAGGVDLAGYALAVNDVDGAGGIANSAPGLGSLIVGEGDLAPRSGVRSPAAITSSRSARARLASAPRHPS